MATFSDGGDVAAMADNDTQDNMQFLLQTLLDNKEKQLQSAATLGHQLLAQRTELQDKIRQMQELELENSGVDESFDGSVRDKYRELVDSIKAWDAENEQLTSVFGSKVSGNLVEHVPPRPTVLHQPTNGVHTPASRHAEPSRNDERSKGGAGPSAAQSSRRAKNAAHRADDVGECFSMIRMSPVPHPMHSERILLRDSSCILALQPGNIARGGAASPC